MLQTSRETIAKLAIRFKPQPLYFKKRVPGTHMCITLTWEKRCFPCLRPTEVKLCCFAKAGLRMSLGVWYSSREILTIVKISVWLRIIVQFSFPLAANGQQQRTSNTATIRTGKRVWAKMTTTMWEGQARYWRSNQGLNSTYRRITKKWLIF